MPEQNFDKNSYDVIILGAGAAGMMCAIEAGKRGRSVLLLDHAQKIGEKIRISGGGRCNFTNIYTDAKHFTSLNKHFCKSALKRYQPPQIMALFDQHNITYHEKADGRHDGAKSYGTDAGQRDLQGQLFGDESAELVVDMLKNEVRQAGVVLRNNTDVEKISQQEGVFSLQTASTRYHDGHIYKADALVIATGGKSIPKIGATGFGYQVAKQFGHEVTSTRPGLVPLTFTDDFKVALKELSGISLMAEARIGKTKFVDDLLFTHRGLSGPVILQISSFWREGQPLTLNLLPKQNLAEALQGLRDSNPKQELRNALAYFLPKRLALYFQEITSIGGPMGGLSNKQINKLHETIHNWEIRPNGTEGYRTAEVTLGGVDTKNISSKTMESSLVPKLYFIGEVLDVTGQLGGFNFQWAWASGHAAGQVC